MTRVQKLAIVAGIQIVVLLSILGFGQWTVWTADTVQLEVSSTTDPQRLGQRNPLVEYEASTLDLRNTLVDMPGFAGALQNFHGDVYVELQRGTDGASSPIAVHDGRDRSTDGTVLITGYLTAYRTAGTSQAHVMYDALEAVYASDSTLARMPTGSGHDIRVEVRVNRFGHGTPLRFIVDGQAYPLERR